MVALFLAEVKALSQRKPKQITNQNTSVSASSDSRLSMRSANRHSSFQHVGEFQTLNSNGTGVPKQ